MRLGWTIGHQQSLYFDGFIKLYRATLWAVAGSKGRPELQTCEAIGLSESVSTAKGWRIETFGEAETSALSLTRRAIWRTENTGNRLRHFGGQIPAENTLPSCQRLGVAGVGVRVRLQRLEPLRGVHLSQDAFAGPVFNFHARLTVLVGLGPNTWSKQVLQMWQSEHSGEASKPDLQVMHVSQFGRPYMDSTFDRNTSRRIQERPVHTSSNAWK